MDLSAAIHKAMSKSGEDSDDTQEAAMMGELKALVLMLKDVAPSPDIAKRAEAAAAMIDKYTADEAKDAETGEMGGMKA